MNRKQRKDKREMRADVEEAIRRFGYDCISSHVVIDHYRWVYPKDEKFLERMELKYGDSAR